MIGFSLLCGHLLGDYILQNDWMAANKAKRGWEGWAACVVHCVLYTLAVWLCSRSWVWDWPLWGLLVVGVAHFAFDRYRLARWWMVNVSGQKAFATGSLSPWSVIIVDNVFHLLTLWVLMGAL